MLVCVVFVEGQTRWSDRFLFLRVPNTSFASYKNLDSGFGFLH